MSSTPPDQKDFNPNRDGSDDEPSKSPGDCSRSPVSNSNSESDVDGSILDPVDPSDVPLPGRALQHKIGAYRGMNISRTYRERESIENVLQFIENITYSRSFLRSYNIPEEFCLRCVFNNICNFCTRNMDTINLESSSSSCSCTNSSESSEDETCAGICSIDFPPMRIGRMFPRCPPILKEPSARSGLPVRRSRERRRRRRNSHARDYVPTSQERRIREDLERNRNPVPDSASDSGPQQTPYAPPAHLPGSPCLSPSFRSSIRKLEIIQALRNRCSTYCGENLNSDCCGAGCHNLNNQDRQPCEVPNCLLGSREESTPDCEECNNVGGGASRSASNWRSCSVPNCNKCNEKFSENSASGVNRQANSLPYNYPTSGKCDDHTYGSSPVSCTQLRKIPDCDECSLNHCDECSNVGGEASRSATNWRSCSVPNCNKCAEEFSANSASGVNRQRNSLPYNNPTCRKCDDGSSSDSCTQSRPMPDCDECSRSSSAHECNCLASCKCFPEYSRRRSPVCNLQGSCVCLCDGERSDCEKCRDGKRSSDETDSEFGGDYDKKDNFK